MAKVIGVRFRYAGKIYDFDAGDKDIKKRGDKGVSLICVGLVSKTLSTGMGVCEHCFLLIIISPV